MSVDQNSIIFSRRYPDLKDKETIWKLVYDSYRGGQSYSEGDYLWKHAKESSASFKKRQERAVYFNQIQPLADLLAGFLFLKPPARKSIDYEWMLKHATKNGQKSLDDFMKTVATYSVLFTCGVLVDSPSFDPNDYPTEKARIDSKLNPFCVLYMPFDIRDFHVGEDGKLDWIILDNTHYDNSDITQEGVYKNVYRVWTREYYQDFEMQEKGTSGESITVGDEKPHNLPEIPFRFVNWKDDDSDFMAESVFEDPAMIGKLIYNKLSEMDEMIAAGSFKVLMYPSDDGSIPASLIAGGIGSLSAIPYKGTFSKGPYFDGAKLEDITPFLKAMEFYISEILKKIGLDTDETKDYVKSGLAKKIDFQKVRTLLVSGSTTLSELEMWIFDMTAAWLSSPSGSTAEVTYNTQYADEDIQLKVDLLNELLVHPYKKLREAITTLKVKHLLSGEVPPSDLEEIYKEIENDSMELPEDGVNLDIGKLAKEDEQAALDEK